MWSNAVLWLTAGSMSVPMYTRSAGMEPVLCRVVADHASEISLSRRMSANTTHWNNVGLTLVQRLRHWPDIKPTLFPSVVWAWMSLTTYCKKCRWRRACHVSRGCPASLWIVVLSHPLHVLFMALETIPGPETGARDVRGDPFSGLRDRSMRPGFTPMPGHLIVARPDRLLDRVYSCHTQRYETLNQCWFNVGPASKTMGQH